MVHQLKTPQRELPVASDPDSVSEIMCDGRLNFTTRGNLATLTFFHDRPKITGVDAPPVLIASDHSVDYTCVRCSTILLHAEESQVRGFLIR